MKHGFIPADTDDAGKDLLDKLTKDVEKQGGKRI